MSGSPPAGAPVITPATAAVAPSRPAPFAGIAYRAIAGRLPLWVAPNTVAGRFHRAAPLTGPAPDGAVPVQYLSLHPMGPLAEAVRHDESGMPERVRRTVFAADIRLRRVLRVPLAEAAHHGIDPAALVGDDLEVTRAWAEEMRRRHPALEGLVVPSAALPGTDNLVVFGARRPSPYPGPARTPVDLPIAVAAVDGHVLARLVPLVHRPGAGDHPGVVALRAGRAFAFRQPSAA